jgi:hypothetical protein
MKPSEKYSDHAEPVLKSSLRTPFTWVTQNGELAIKGKSGPEDASQYLESIREWVDDYIKHPSPSTTLTINLEYLNGITSHYLYGIIRKLHNACNDVVVNWEFRAGDEECLAQGQNLASLCKAKFKFIRIHDQKG